MLEMMVSRNTEGHAVLVLNIVFLYLSIFTSFVLFVFLSLLVREGNNVHILFLPVVSLQLLHWDN